MTPPDAHDARTETDPLSAPALGPDAEAADGPPSLTAARASAPVAAPTAPAPASTLAPALPAAVLAVIDDEATDAADPAALDAADAAPDLALGAGPSTPAGTRAVPPGAGLPARLSPSAWLGALGAASGRSVQVALGDDGTVRLRTDHEGDGVTVRLHFSDPELQSLAGAHAGRLRDVLAEHFAEPVQLSLADGSTTGDGAATGDGSTGSHAGTPGERSGSASSSAALDSSPTSPRSFVAGRREWIG